MNKKLGFISLLTAGLLFGSFGIWIRLLSQELTIYQQIVLRNMIGALFCAIIVYTKFRQGKKLIGGSKKHLLIYSLLVPVVVIFYNLALIQAKIGVALFAFYAGSLAMSLPLGKLVYNESFPFTKKAALALSLAGLAAFLYPFSLISINLGIVYGLIAGALDGVTNAFRKSFIATNKFFVALLTMLGGVTVSGSLTLIFDQNPLFLTQLSPFAIGIGVLFGLLLISVNYLILAGFQNFDLNLGTIVISSEIFFGLIFGLIIYSEIPAPNEFIGGLLIVSAIIISNLKILKKKQPALPSIQ